MTDLEKLKELLTNANIQFEMVKHCIIVEGQGRQNIYTVFGFNPDHSLRSVSST